MRIKIFLPLLFIASMVSAQVKNSNSNDQQFLTNLDSIRVSLKIPGMAVAVMQDNHLVLENGLGYADLKNQIKVTPATTFKVASITKTFASTIIMQLVEQGKLDLGMSLSAMGVDLGNPNITVRHLLTHTSEGEPGNNFQYNGYRFGLTEKAIVHATGKQFYQLLMENIVKPAGMSSTAPGISLFNYFDYTKKYQGMIPFFETAFKNLSKPYGTDNNGSIIEINYLDEFGTFGGLITNVHDLLKYSTAIDKNQFVSEKTQALIFTPNKTKSGVVTPYGLGWFTQQYKGVDFYWHYGQTQGESGLFVKVPSLKLTLVVLTNTARLSSLFPLGDGDLFTSPVGQLFYKYFVNKSQNLSLVDFGLPTNEIRKELSKINRAEFKDFYNKEIISQSTVYNANGEFAKAKALYELYADFNFQNPQKKSGSQVVAEIIQVGIDKEISKPFSLSKETRVRVHGVGENCSSDFKSWCDYGWIEDHEGKVIWQMQGQPASSAGGVLKNQMVDVVVSLPPGNYTLKYKSDWAHGYDNWDSLPPDNFVWGIMLLDVE